MESTMEVVDLSCYDEPDDINSLFVEFIDKWPIDRGSCDGDNIIKEFLNHVETSSFVEQNQVCVDDDCIILDGDPNKPVVVIVDEKNKSHDLLIVKENGEVACRDFPHSRHSCASFPFNTTSHEKHCKMCHCFVCDSPAPCKFWGNSLSLGGHCHASDKFESWISLRKVNKEANANSHRQVPNVYNPSNATNNAFSGLANIYMQQVQNTNSMFNTSNLNVLIPCFTVNNTFPQLNRSQAANLAYGCAHNIQTRTLPDMNYNSLRLPTSEKHSNSKASSSVKQYLELPLARKAQFKKPGTPGCVSASMSRALQTLSNPPRMIENTHSTVSDAALPPKKNVDAATVEDMERLWHKLAAIADELDVSECISNGTRNMDPNQNVGVNAVDEYSKYD